MASSRIQAWRLALVLLLLLVPAMNVSAQARMQAIPEDKLTPAQKKAFDEFKAARKQTTLAGPWTVLIRVPELLTLSRMWRDHVQNRTVLGNKLSELVILITAREWTQQYEWNAHYQAAMKAGVRADIVQSIADGRRPDQMADDERAVYDLCTELQRNHSVSDATYARALAKLGEDGIVEAASIQGFYTLLAMNMNAARTPLPSGAQPPLGLFPH
jgi:4-carboxymuconolactone decarboxylase